MIKVNELRIGNKLHFNDSIITVKQIRESSVVYESFWESKLLHDTPNLFADTPDVPEEIIKEASFLDCTPIALTPKVLTSLGARFDTKVEEQSKLEWILSNFDARQEGDYVFFYGGAIEYDLQYVHQLQNLYFMITGEELDVRL